MGENNGKNKVEIVKGLVADANKFDLTDLAKEFAGMTGTAKEMVQLLGTRNAVRGKEGETEEEIYHDATADADNTSSILFEKASISFLLFTL